MKRTVLSVAAVVALLLASSSPSSLTHHHHPFVLAQQQQQQQAANRQAEVEALIHRAVTTSDVDATSASNSSGPSSYYHSYTALERDNAASWDLFDRVVVMGDMHGDVRKLHMLLRGAGLVGRRATLPTDPPIAAGDIYPEWHWRAKRTLLVQLGDMVDRGWYDLEVVRYLMRLEAEARAMDSAVEVPSQTGASTTASTGASTETATQDDEDVIVTIDTSNKVITRDSASAAEATAPDAASRGAARAVILLGNHEVMQLSGQMHYASAQATQGWGGAATRHRDLDRDAPIGQWLRRRPVVMLAWDTIFVHAGLSTEAIDFGADGLNERMWRQLNATIAPPPHPSFDHQEHEALKSPQEAAERAEIRRRRERLDALAPQRRGSSKRRAPKHAVTADGRTMSPEEVAEQAALDRAFAEEEDFMMGESGPVWTRRMVNLAQAGRCDLVTAALRAWNKSRIIVGHTPTRTAQVEAHCGGRLIAADTGLSEWMYGGKSIVEMKKVKGGAALGAGAASHANAPQGNDDTRVEVAELTFENEAQAEAAAAEIEAAELAALHTQPSGNKIDAAAAAGAQTAEEVEAALRGDPEALQEILQLLAEQKRAADAAAKRNGQS